eukprot:scaffold66298_cov22-Tisochrysis_lutea.AAC.1
MSMCASGWHKEPFPFCTPISWRTVSAHILMYARAFVRLHASPACSASEKAMCLKIIGRMRISSEVAALRQMLALGAGQQQAIQALQVGGPGGE